MKRFRVIPGGKSRQDIPDTRTPCLFRAHSIGTIVKGDSVFEQVSFHWYCLDRDHPPIAYSLAIAGYEQMEENLRRPLERFVDRHFTEAELGELGAYLESQYGLGLEPERVSLPVKDRTFLFEEGTGVIYEFLELSERSGYPLPFKVWGYFTLQGRRALPNLEEGVSFVEEVLKKLGLVLPVDRGQMERILRDVYSRTGLAVKRSDGEDPSA